MSDVRFQVGESFVGDGVNAAHINVVLGDRNGPAGTAWATALGSPTAGHVPFVAVLRPSLLSSESTWSGNDATAAPGPRSCTLAIDSPSPTGRRPFS